VRTTRVRLTTVRQALYKRDHDMAAKTPGQRKTKGILIRVTETQKRVLAKTAKRAGLGLSSWMLSVALRAAQKMKSA
jgi:uncharacterized protein (DUF1778 family)